MLCGLPLPKPDHTSTPHPREQFLPIVTRPGADGVEELEPVRWNGSADVVGIARARALAVVPADAPLLPEQGHTALA